MQPTELVTIELEYCDLELLIETLVRCSTAAVIDGDNKLTKDIMMLRNRILLNIKK